MLRNPRVLICLTLIIGTGSVYTLYSQGNLSDPFILTKSMANPVEQPLKSVTLVAREEQIPPDGIVPQPNRDIGFASVFIRLENSQTKTVKIRIEKIEIRSATDGKLQPFTFSPQEIELKPLEYSELAFQLSNKTGYLGQDRVKAVVTFKIDNQVKMMESEPVTIQR